jgi:hypothetical protein
MAASRIRPVHLCFDRIVPLHHKVGAAALSMRENSANTPDLRLLPGVSAHPLKMALVTGKRWANGRRLGVRFLDGSATQRKKTQRYAEMWERWANINFDFSSKGAARGEIRVSFVADDGSWSAVGTDCLLTDYFPGNEPTMNFGWLRDDTDDVEWRRVVTHEFGHALSAIHEHQNPKGGIKWDVAAVYRYFGGPPNNWSKEEIDHNVIQKYSISQLNATKFDPKSIMLYSFPPELTLDHKGTKENTDVSPGDRKFIAKMYPKKKK